MNRSEETEWLRNFADMYKNYVRANMKEPTHWLIPEKMLCEVKDKLAYYCTYKCQPTNPPEDRIMNMPVLYVLNLEQITLIRIEP